MFWLNFEGLWINGDHLQGFKWENGILRVYLLGVPTPEMFNDPNGVMFDKLAEAVEGEIRRRRAVDAKG